MNDFPNTTIVNKKITQKLLKKYVIDAEDNEVILRNILKEELGYYKSTGFEEILIIEIKLKSQHLPEKLIQNLSLNIPYKILFILNFENRYNFAIATFEPKLLIRYSVWGKDFKINLKTSSLDEIWKSILENFNLKFENTDIISDEEAKLQKELSTLEKLLIKEVDFSKKVEIRARINKIKKELKYDN